MIRYRSFRNSDPPALAEIWRSASQRRALAQPMSAEMLERLVLAKPYFDNSGLILAESDGQPVGFVHAGFGPGEDRSSLSYRRGVICMLMVRPEHRQSRIGTELTQRAEAYLKQRGAETIFGGATPELNPFYVGLYGGSEMPGVLESDPLMHRFVRAAGFQPTRRRVVFQSDLTAFRPPIDRRQMQVRRTVNVVIDSEPRARDWWDACTYGSFEQSRLELRSRGDDQPLAEATAWFMLPLSATWGVRAVGIKNIFVVPERRGAGFASFLLGELLRQLQNEGVTLVEMQCDEDDAPSCGLARKLGFDDIDRGIIYAKDDPA